MVTVQEEKIRERLGDLLSKAYEIVNQLDEANASLDEINEKLEVLDDILVQINALIDLVEDIKEDTAAIATSTANMDAMYMNNTAENCIMFVIADAA